MYTLNDINQEMSDLHDWSLEGNSITKVYNFTDFKESLEFVNKVGEVAEKLNHHPDILINYDKVKLQLTTHNAGGLTKIDFDVAKEIDKL